MKKLDAERFSIALFISAVSASALTMLWLLWHFPVATATGAIIALGIVVAIARVAKTIDMAASPAADRHDSHTA